MSNEIAKMCMETLKDNNEVISLHTPTGVQENKPGLLILTQVLPFPPDAGPKIKTFNLIKYLSRDFSITLVSFVRPDNTPEHTQALLKYCREVYTVPMLRSRTRNIISLAASLVLGQPFLMVRDRSREMSSLLKALVARAEFAAVHADQLNMAQFALALPVTPRVLDQHNAVWTIADRLQKGESNPLKRLLLKLETFKLRRYERKVCRKFQTVLAVSPQDEAALELPCHVIPIGVDAEETKPLELTPGSKNLVSLGTMFYPPNVEAALWFGQKVFPLIQQQQPEATYTIIGAKPPASIYEMAKLNPAIRVLGYVEDLASVLKDSAALVVPLLSGGGMRVKILDALAFGLPIVTTTVGAEGVKLTHNLNALIADSEEAFAHNCLRLLEDNQSNESLIGKLALAGRNLVLDTYDFRRAYQPLDEIYAQLLSQSNN